MTDLPTGLWNERTTLAWVRSALSLVGVGALVAKQSGSVIAAAVVLAAVFGVGGWMLIEAERRHHARGRAIEYGDPVVALHHVAAATVAVTALAAAGLAVVLLRP